MINRVRDLAGGWVKFAASVLTLNVSIDSAEENNGGGILEVV